MINTNIKLNLDFSHQLKLTHKTRNFNIYGAFATQMADATLVEAIASLDEACRQLNLGDLLFPAGRAFGDSQSMGQTRRRAENEGDEDGCQQQAIAEEQDFGAAQELLDMSKIIQRSLNQKLLQHPPVQLSTYIACLYNPLADEELGIGQKIPELFDPLLEPEFGQLMVKRDKLAKQLNLPEASVQAMREAVASSCIPMGLGFSSHYEYRDWLCKYMLGRVNLPYPEADLQLFNSYRLRKKLYQTQAKDAPVIIQALSKLLHKQHLAFQTQGIQAKVPRSSSRLMATYGCDAQQAKEIIRLYRLLPSSPIEDMQPDKGQNKKQSAQRTASPEFEITITERHQIKVQWAGKVSETVTKLTSAEVEQIIQRLQQCTEIKFKDEQQLEEKLKDLQETGQIGEEANALDLASRFLLDHGETELVKTEQAINRKINNAGETHKKSPLTKAKARQMRLRNIVRHYQHLKEALDLKPEIVKIIAKIQQDYLYTGDIEKLKPLTKTQIVQQMGYQPSGRPVDNEEDKKSQNIGRRIERYIKKMYIVYPDKAIDRLDRLIPGHAGVKDYAGNHVLDLVIKKYIRELLVQEFTDSPLSDQKISNRLAEEYAIPVQRTLVKKYRMSMGIESSQVRKKL